METEEKTFRPAAVIFDMDGLMLDTERLTIPLWDEAGKKFGYNIPVDIVLQMVGISGEESRMVLLGKYGDDFPYEKIRDEHRLLCKREFEKGVPHKNGLVFLLDRLCAAKIPIAVATSTRKATALEVLDKAGILDRFTAITGGDEVANGKPAPDIFLLAAEKLGQPPSACVGFEDSPAGLQGLHVAGIRSVFIKDIIEPPEKILASVWRRCDDLAEAAELFGC
ncbi:MAG: HAD family phosphatase [Treponema sp.]|jgi:HAD superfamily hydrolase (TIGR01509 family)|nr:HAD family phosphatase [Treponema sp.]